MATIQLEQASKGSKSRKNDAGSNEREKGDRLSDLAYRLILRGLFTKAIDTGAFLSQNELAKIIDVPIQPLRDALRVLEAEGVLRVQPRSGIQFLKPNLEFAQNTFQFRAALESPAARRYAETASMKEIQSLLERHEALVDQLSKDVVSEQELEQLDELESDLHGGMISNMNNPLMAVTARRLNNYVTLILLDRTLTPPVVRQTLREHIEILKACENRDPDGAEQALRGHLRAALQRHLGMF